MDSVISVIVPVYNVKKYVAKCIESIINQTYKHLEILLINDGSTDESGMLCDLYGEKDHRIRVIHKENGGLSDARNKGLEHATGEYISFIDSDDFIHEVFYETLMNLIVSNKADIAQCNFLKVYEEDNAIRSTDVDEKTATYSNIEALDRLYKNIVKVVVWNKLYKRELLSDIQFPKGKIHEDEFTTYRILYKAGRIVTTSKPMYYYLQRTNSITGGKFNEKRLATLEASKEQIRFFDQRNLYKLKDKAIIRLETKLTGLMRDVIKSDKENKEELFQDLRKCYKDSFHLFRDELGSGTVRRKPLMYVCNYSPDFVIKILCALLDIKSIGVQIVRDRPTGNVVRRGARY
ncbi:glycosyltransferase [Oceanobacillus bengalensis]|nr:glycosyltransferase [Oceanobacillus bengalensis]